MYTSPETRKHLSQASYQIILCGNQISRKAPEKTS